MRVAFVKMNHKVYVRVNNNFEVSKLFLNFKCFFYELTDFRYHIKRVFCT